MARVSLGARLSFPSWMGDVKRAPAARQVFAEVLRARRAAEAERRAAVAAAR